jgi:Type IV secretion system pilin
MKRFVLIALTALTLVVSGLALHVSPVLADAKADICSGVGAVSGANGCDAPKGSPTVNSVINNVINIISAFVGILAVIMIVFAGFRYVTAAGDSGKISSAKNTLIYAIVGLVVAGVAQLIVRYVVTNVVK